VKNPGANGSGFVALLSAEEELKMDKVVAALETSLARTTEPALRAQLEATIERLRRSKYRKGEHRPPAGNAKAPRRESTRRRG